MICQSQAVILDSSNLKVRKAYGSGKQNGWSKTRNYLSQIKWGSTASKVMKNQVTNLTTKPPLFGDNWTSHVSTQAPKRSWAYQVMKSADAGNVYLNTLRTWYYRFPRTSKTSIELKNRLESLRNEDHLGAVNELFWWECMKLFNWSAEPVVGRKHKRPDFKVTSPAYFFCEVTTLNISGRDRDDLSEGHGVGLNEEQTRTIDRLFLKILEEKLEQIQCGASEKKPNSLVLFDHTVWSQLGTEFYLKLAFHLLGEQMGFARLPRELSAIVYIERRVMAGRLGMSEQRAAVYHNPFAQIKIPPNVFQMIRQYDLELVEVPRIPSPTALDGWIWV